MAKPSNAYKVKKLLEIATLKAAASFSHSPMSAANLYVTKVEPDPTCRELDCNNPDHLFSGLVHMRDLTTSRSFKLYVDGVRLSFPFYIGFPGGKNIESRKILLGSATER